MMMILLCANRARCTGFVSFSAVIIFLTASATVALADSGIAARYPNDKGIGSDPDVIMAEDFESYTAPDQLLNNGKWNQLVHRENMRIASEAGVAYAGAKAIEYALPISATELSIGAHKTVSQDVLYVRAYEKFDSGYFLRNSNHNGISISAKYPGPGGGTPADGTGWFLFLVQNNILSTPRTGESDPGFFHYYVYWPKQRSLFGDHFYPDGTVNPYSSATGADGKIVGNRGDWLAWPNQYPTFNVMANIAPPRGQWFCAESMVKANTPGQKDGEVRFWYNGKLAAAFTNLNIRSISTLKIDKCGVGLHAQHSERVNKKWYDNVVIARQYIGPMASASPVPSPTPTPAARLQNISSRLLIQTGSNVGIAGFVVEGTEAKKLLIRGLGPTLAQFNVTDVMQNPILELHDGSGSLITTNDDWKDTQQAEIAATQLAPPADAEAAILATLQPGAYTAIQTGAGGGTGVGLIEVYDVDPLAASRLINISTRGLVQTGNNVLIAGCSLAGGSGSNDVVVRALGPSLVPLGVNNALPDPVVTLYDSNANVITTNDNWKDSQRSVIENLGLQPPNDLDAAILITLAAGNYTAIVTDKNGSTGVGLVEVYATQ
jgi:hypothetical protein